MIFFDQSILSSVPLLSNVLPTGWFTVNIAVQPLDQDSDIRSIRDAGDVRTAFEILLSRYRKDIERRCRRRSRPWLDWTDLYQEVAQRAITGFESWNGPYFPWFIRIVDTAFIDMFRARRRSVSLCELVRSVGEADSKSGVVNVTPDVFDAIEATQTVHHLVSHLSDADRALIVNRFGIKDGIERSYSELAASSSPPTTEDAIRMRISRAIVALARIVKEEGL